jgi:hypothetical protein
MTGFFGVKRYGLGLCVSLLMLAGCAGSPPSPAVPATSSQSLAIAAHGEPGESWMLPEAKNENLLYDAVNGAVWVYSYPQGEIVGRLTVPAVALCTDAAGNLWMVGSPSEHFIAEYAHGGEKPIKILQAENLDPAACSIDPTTGDLAVVGGGRVNVYARASGPPTKYKVSNGTSSCTYDGDGNLFVLGNNKSDDVAVAELRKGATKFHGISGYTNDTGYPGKIQWDGKYVAIGYGAFTTPEILRFAIRGWHAIAHGKGCLMSDILSISDFWIQGSKVVATNFGGSGTYFAPAYLYDYPKCGSPIKLFAGVVGEAGGGSVAVSLAPK